MDSSRRHWTVFFFLAAAFDFCVGGPIFFAPAWSCPVAYILLPDDPTLRFRGDFGHAVMLIGLGCAILGLNVDRNRGVVCLGFVWFLVKRPAVNP